MRSLLRPSNVGVLAALLLCACTNGEATPPADGGGGAGGGGGPSLWTCQQIRVCAFDCVTDACLDTCAAKGSADAQAKFQSLRACTAKACTPVTDINCACAEQCLDGGGCFAEVAACLAGASGDLICDSELCH